MTSSNRDRLTIAAALGAVILAFRTLILPRSLWEFDETLFMEGVLKFEPLRHHPHPPGYPVTIALGKLVHLFVADPFRSLLIVSLIASAIGTMAFFLAASEMLNDVWSALAATLFFHASAAMLIHGPLALSDPPALMFLCIAVLAMTRMAWSRGWGWSVVFGASLATAIGCRPQYAAALVPLLFLGLIPFDVTGEESLELSARRRRGWFRAATILGAFVISCLLWLAPLIVILGGPRSFLHYELGQAAYVSAHDAAISRSGYSSAGLFSTFVAHPFGPKWLALPIFALAALGLLRRRIAGRHAILLFTLLAVHLSFTLWSSDPADAVRYMLPTVVSWALFAGAGAWGLGQLLRFRLAPLIAGVIFAALSLWYCSPILLIRHRYPSPIVQAAIYVNRSIPRSALILCPVSLRPHSEILFRRYQVLPLERGMALSAHDLRRPVYRLTDGPTVHQALATFSWPASDAYRKLTRNHYRVINVVPLPPAERFEPLLGVDTLESDAQGVEWRWLHQFARIKLPALQAQYVELVLGLSSDASIPWNDVSISAGGEIRSVRVLRGATARVELPFLPASPIVELRSSHSFRPLTHHRHHNRDPRDLAVQLRSVTLR